MEDRRRKRSEGKRGERERKGSYGNIVNMLVKVKRKRERTGKEEAKREGMGDGVFSRSKKTPKSPVRRAEGEEEEIKRIMRNWKEEILGG